MRNPAQVTPAPAAALVIFGAMGDLSRRLLGPALANLTRDGLIGDNLQILGVSHGDTDDAALREALGSFIDRRDEALEQAWHSIARRAHYLRGDFGDQDVYRRIAERLKQIGRDNVVFYLATAPGFFAVIVDRLAEAGLLDEKDGFRRVVVEKPFGHDLASAKALNARMLKVMEEKQIYRIDHFLGKETVQNIMVARFGNSLFESQWNNRYIDHVQITAAELVGVGTRGKTYDATGALRDMVPNHLFQLLSMIAMEPPNSFRGEAVRNEKAKVIESVRIPTEEDARLHAVRGRYTAGSVAGKPMRDYLAEPNVAQNSRTETYVALKLFVDNWRWAGVPFYLRTGKALSARDTEIVVTFRPVPFTLFHDAHVESVPPNRLVVQIQPREGLSFDLIAKQPGPSIRTAPVSMDFCYADHFRLGPRTGYETLLYDVLIGDQSLFQRADMVELGWAIVQPILDLWAAEGEPETYVAGGDGPACADELIRRDGRAWHEIG